MAAMKLGENEKEFETIGNEIVSPYIHDKYKELCTTEVWCTKAVDGY